MLRNPGFFPLLTSKCASRHNGVLNFQKWSGAGVVYTFWLGNVFRARATFHLSSGQMWLRTRRFSEPSFRPSGATNHWKNAVFREFPTFWRTCIFFLLTLSLLWSSLFCSSPLWLFPPLLFHLSILSEVWLLNFLWLTYLCLLFVVCSTHSQSHTLSLLHICPPGARTPPSRRSPKLRNALPRPPNLSRDTQRDTHRHINLWTAISLSHAISAFSRPMMPTGI